MESIGFTPATMEMVATRDDPDIEVQEYQDSWRQAFLEVSARIESALGSQILKLEHVGSTSVPGLAAKPIIDILIEVSDPSNETAYVPALERLGFTLLFRQPKWHGHRFLFVDNEDPGKCSINVHIHSHGCQIAAELVIFRDFLRECEWARDQYVEAKKSAAGVSNEEEGGRARYLKEKKGVLDGLKEMALARTAAPGCAQCRVG